MAVHAVQHDARLALTISGTTRQVCSRIDREHPVTQSAVVRTRYSGVPGCALLPPASARDGHDRGARVRRFGERVEEHRAVGHVHVEQIGREIMLQRGDLLAYLADPSHILSVERGVHRDTMYRRAAPRLLLGPVTRLGRSEHVDDVPALGEGTDVLTQQRLEATEIRRKYG